MEIKKGIGVSPGVVVGTAIVLDAEDFVVPRREVDPRNVPAEIERLKSALARSVTDLGGLRDESVATAGKEIGSIFDFHLGVLNDKSLVQRVIKEIQDKRTTAEYSVSLVMREYA